jgi:hypothetical protein
MYLHRTTARYDHHSLDQRPLRQDSEMRLLLIEACLDPKTLNLARPCEEVIIDPHTKIFNWKPRWALIHFR